MGTVQDPEPTTPKSHLVKKRRPLLDDEGHPRFDDNNEPLFEEMEVLVEDSPSDAPPSPPSDAEPRNYTICSPQLLHLDLEGKPLWFNGWLLDNKFADKKQKKFGRFQHYLIEPKDVREPGAWQLEESNMCCLTTDKELKRDFSEEEKGVLEMMISQAKEVGVAP